MITKIKSLIWDQQNRNHIQKHNVSEVEVEEVCTGIFKQQPTYNERYLIFGKTIKGRLLTIVLTRKKKGAYYIITARDMSVKERRRFIK